MLGSLPGLAWHATVFMPRLPSPVLFSPNGKVIRLHIRLGEGDKVGG